MWNRVLACALLIGTSSALAAPPTAAPVAPQDIDVDALARAKDVDAKAADATPDPAPDSAAAAAESASATEPVATTPAAETTGAAADEVPATDAVAEAPAAEATSTAPAADAPPAADTTATEKADSETTPAATAEAEERRLAASCVARASSLLDAAEKGDYAAATQDFDARMAAALPPAKFAEAWGQLAQFGKLTARGQSHPIKGEGYLAVTIPLIFEKKNLYAQVTCGSDGRVAGFYVKPLEIPGQ